MCQLHWATRCPDIWSIFILGVSEDVLGWVNCTDRYTDRIKQAALSNVGWVSSVAGLIRTKMLILLGIRGNSSFLPAFEVAHWFFSYIWSISSSWPQACQSLDWNCQISWFWNTWIQTVNYDISSPGSPAYQLQTLRLFRLHNCESQCFVINLFLSVYSWHLNNVGVRGTNPLALEKYAYDFIAGPLSPQFCICRSKQPWMMQYRSTYLMKNIQV